jgi:hypothetical protein
MLVKGRTVFQATEYGWGCLLARLAVGPNNNPHFSQLSGGFIKSFYFSLMETRVFSVVLGSRIIPTFSALPPLHLPCQQKLF